MNGQANNNEGPRGLRRKYPDNRAQSGKIDIQTILPYSTLTSRLFYINRAIEIP